MTENSEFWDSLESGEWEPDTFKIFDTFVTEDTYFLDIGSWIGPTALYAAQIARQTYAFEPDPVAYKELIANVEANDGANWIGRLQVWNKAVAEHDGKIKLGSRLKVGDSMSSVLFADEANSWEVETVGFDKLLQGEQLKNKKLFVKMDIEGGEFKLIPALRETLQKHDITLYLSTHPIFTTIKRFKNGRMNFVGRIICCWHQFKLVRQLPFKYLYYQDGRTVNLFADMMSTMSGRLPLFEILATNKRWGT